MKVMSNSTSAYSQLSVSKTCLCSRMVTVEIEIVEAYFIYLRFLCMYC